MKGRLTFKEFQTASINTIYGDYLVHDYTEITVGKPVVESFGPWYVMERGLFSVVVYDAQGRFKEVVTRHCNPGVPFGPWSVWRFSYAGKKRTSLVDEIWGFLTVREGEIVK